MLGILLFPAWAWAYRPFVSTDTAVADPKECEIELGYFNLEHRRHDNTIAARLFERQAEQGAATLSEAALDSHC